MATRGAETAVQQLYDELWNRGDLRVAEGLLAPEFVRHAPPSAPGQAGVGPYTERVAAVRAAFPDVHFAVDDLVVGDDRVTVRWTAEGTHRGPFMGVEATGHTVRVSGLELYRVVAGRIAEAWVSWDGLGMLEQLGAVGAKAQAKKDLVRRWLEEGWQAADPKALIDEVFTEDFELDSPRGAMRGKAAYREQVRMVKSAFPDIRFVLVEAVAAGDRVAFRWRAEGTHLGQFMGVAPTGRRIALTGSDFVTFRDGRIASAREEWDALGLMKQIQAAPTP